jgi:hypothetical protein
MVAGSFLCCPDKKTSAQLADKAPPHLIVIPAKAGIYRQYEAWIPAFAGMTIRLFESLR